MSTYAYSRITSFQKAATRSDSKSAAPGQQGLGNYVAAAAALVPAEVLAAHAAFLTFTTGPSTTNPPVTIITDIPALSFAFFSLFAISILIFVLPKLKEWDKKDYFRAAISPLAFVAWTMMQRLTAFDAVFGSENLGLRTAIAVVLVILLGLAAAYLNPKTD